MKVLRVEEKWEKRFCFLLYRDFLFYMRLLVEDWVIKDCFLMWCGVVDENEKNYGFYVDDEGYLVGEIYV